jgi:hypothetical protein
MRNMELKIRLNPQALADLDAVAAELGKERQALAGEIVATWIGDRLDSQVPDHKYREAARRMAILEKWWTLRRKIGPEAATTKLLSRMAYKGLELSRGTLYNWDRLWRQKGLAGLVDRRGGRAAQSKGEKMIQWCRRLLMQQRRPRLSDVYQAALRKAEKSGWEVVSQRTAARRIR